MKIFEDDILIMPNLAKRCNNVVYVAEIKFQPSRYRRLFIRARSL